MKESIAKLCRDCFYRIRQLVLDHEYVENRKENIKENIKENLREWIEGCREWAQEDAHKAVLFWQEIRSGKRQVNLWGWAGNRRIQTGVFAGFLLLGANFYLINNSLVYAVSYQGKEVAFVGSVKEAENLKSRFEQELVKLYGKGVFLEDLTYQACVRPNAQLFNEDKMLVVLQGLPWQVQASEILVNGEPVVVVESADMAKKVLAKLGDLYKKETEGKNLQVSYKEKITFRECKVALQGLASEEEAIAALSCNKGKLVDYVVRNGDSLWSIARAHNLLVADIYAANPQLRTHRLDIGQTLKLGTVEPLLSVLTSTTITRTVKVPYNVKVERDSSLWSGETVVRRQGKEGEAVVVYKVTRKNGVVANKEIVEKTVLKKPVDKIVARGSRYTVAYSSRGSGSGVLNWPVQGIITSGYGWRGREFHAAIDIGASTGTPIGAAAGGRVISTGWNGGYGKTVLIDHGDGLTTRYAHLSRIAVSNGESVNRGEVIGSVGSTGRSTGPHLHFEVIVNGNRVNPLNYLH